MAILKHLRYEITMLFAWPTFPNAEKYAQIVILESRLIHARALHEFFTKKKNPHPYDVRVEHFGFKPRKVGITQDDINRMHQDLAHISYRRLEKKMPEDWIWTTKDFVDPLRKVSIEFCEHVVKKYADAMDSEELGQWKTLLQSLREKGWVKLVPKPNTLGFYDQEVKSNR